MSDIPLDACTATNDDVGSLNSCTGEIEYAQYGYNVSQGRAITVLAIFSLLTLAHFLQALVSKCWFLLPTVTLCALGEVIGWAARLISARTTEWRAEFGGYWNSSRESFMAQIATLVIAPVFLTAGWYILLGQLIRLLGPQYGRLHHRTYALIFVTADVLCLVVQAIGGGSAASAETDEDAETGATTMVAGVFLQMAVMVGFVLIFVDFFIAYRKRRPVSQIRFAFWKPKPAVETVSPDDLAPDVERKAQYLLWATAVSVLMVFVRSIYRCIELLDGWDGPIIQNEVLFCTLDALPIAVALVIFNLVHPMWHLEQAHEWTRAGEEIALAEKKDKSTIGSVLPAN